MKTITINISGIYDITEFVKQATKVEGDVIVSKGNRHVDGTSLVGMLSLDTTGGIQVTFPQNAFEFEVFLTNFAG